MHPLYDMDSQRKVHDYKELASQFIYWCKENTSLLQDRAFPTSLVELKRLLNDLNRFRAEEIPSKQRELSKLFQMYKELEVVIDTNNMYPKLTTHTHFFTEIL